jgi:hypothetical protein
MPDQQQNRVRAMLKVNRSLKSESKGSKNDGKISAEGAATQQG